MDKPTIKKMNESENKTYKVGDNIEWISAKRTKKTVTYSTNSGTVLAFRTVKQILCKNNTGKITWIDAEVLEQS